MKIILLVISIFFIGNLYSQDLSGTWTGTSEKKITISNPKSINLELIQSKDSLYSGVIHNEYKRAEFEHIKISGVFHSFDSSFTLTEDSVLSFKKSIFEEICLGKATLHLEKTDSSLLMKGIWKDKKTGIFKCPSLKIVYEKKLEKLISAPAGFERETDVQQVINISQDEKDSIKIELYDSGEIDGDSVSVLLNDIEIEKNIRLLASAHTLTISLNPKIKINKLSLYAQNLGSIPPNTAYMIVTTKKHKYEMHLSSSLQRNAVLEFQFID